MLYGVTVVVIRLTNRERNRGLRLFARISCSRCTKRALVHDDSLGTQQEPLTLTERERKKTLSRPLEPVYRLSHTRVDSHVVPIHCCCSPKKILLSISCQSESEASKQQPHTPPTPLFGPRIQDFGCRYTLYTLLCSGLTPQGKCSHSHSLTHSHSHTDTLHTRVYPSHMPPRKE